MTLACCAWRSRFVSPADCSAILAQIVAAALMMAYALTGFAVLHTLTLAMKSRALLARLHLCRRRGVRLARSGDGGPRACRCCFRISPALSAGRPPPSPLPELYPSTHSTISSHQRRTNMEVILLERVAKLGQMGKSSASRTDLPAISLKARQGAARHAENRAKFDGMKADLEARNLQAKGEATKVAEKIDGRNVVVLRQASETGQLFGSVTFATSSHRSRATASPLAAARSCWTRRSRPSASTRSPSPCIRKSRSASRDSRAKRR